MKNKNIFYFLNLKLTILLAIYIFVLLSSLNMFSLASNAETEMIVATFHPRSGTADVESLFYFKELVEKTSNGKIKVNVFYGGTLGGQQELIDQVRLGTIHLSIASATTYDSYVPNISPWGVPYLFSDKEEFMKTWTGNIGDRVNEIMEEKGLIFGGIIFRGNRQLTSNKIVKVPEDLKGLKLRLPELEGWVVVWKALGAIPVPIPSPEVFSSLQMGVVDAQENPNSSNYSKRLWEVQKYTILTNHIIDWQTFLLSKKFLDSLEDEDRKIIMDSISKTVVWYNDFSEKQEQELVEEMKEEGMEFITIDTELFKEVALSTMDWFKSSWEPWVYQEVMDIVSKKE